MVIGSTTSRSALAGLRAGLALCTAVLWAPAAAFAQTSADVAAQAVPSTVAQSTPGIEQITVNGSYAQSLQGAQDAKQNASYILDAVNAEDIGKLPARDVAESLQVIPGVAITRQRGEGLFVSVRGLGPQFQNVVLNGRTIAVNDNVENGGTDGRSFRYEVLPSEFVSQLEVVKSPTPDMEQGAIGGNINVKTFQPLQLGTMLTAAGQGEYNTMTDAATPQVSGLGSWVNDQKTFGVLFAVLKNQRKDRNDRFYGFGWQVNEFDGPNGSNNAGPLPAGLYTPTRTRPTIETEDRFMTSLATAVQWKPNSQFETRIDGLYSLLDVHYDEFGMDVYPDDRSQSPPVFVNGSQTIVGNTVAGGTINNVRWMSSRETSMNRHELAAYGLNQAWTPDNATKVAVDLSYSRAHSYHPTLEDATTRDRFAFFAPLTYNYTGDQNPPLFTTNVDLNNPANYSGQAFQVAPKNSLDRVWATRLDGSRDFDGWLSKVSIGGEYESTERLYIRRDWSLNTILGVPITQLGPSFYQAFPFGSSFEQGIAGDFPRTWLVPSATAFRNLIFTPAVQSQPRTASDDAASFHIKDGTWSAYARGDYDFTLAGFDVSGNVGLRYLEGLRHSMGTVLNGTVGDPVDYAIHYDYWLPSANLKAEITPDLLLRFAASRAVSFPTPNQEAPTFKISTDQLTATGGNPNLKPFQATQADVSLEWYFAKTGSLAVGAFWKRFDDFITQSNEQIITPFRSQPVILATNINGGTAQVQGLEFAYQQQFDFLPEPFNGLGTKFSATWVGQEADYVAANGPATGIVGLSRVSYNLVAFYDSDGISAHIGYFWRDKYLDNVGSIVAAPTEVAPYGSLDGSVSYQFTDNLSAYVDFINLSDSMLIRYGAVPIRGQEINDWGRTFTFGARVKF